MHDDEELSPAQIKAITRRMMRWRVLKTIYMGQDIGVNETIIHFALNKSDIEVTEQGVRVQLDYLAGLGLIHLTQGRHWNAKITPQGIDVVEYTTDCPPGILRPEVQA
jgi:1,4-alpha-glucan branching enzyme